MKKTESFYRQGDIAFIPGKMQKNGKKKILLDGIIAKGEATGHSHRLLMEIHGVNLFEEENGTMWIEVADGSQATIVHEEHDTISLPVGEWLVRRQREYSPDRIRMVRD